MKRLRIGICIVMLALMVMPVNSAYAGEYDDDFATVSTWLNDINGKLALVYSESTNILMQLNQRTISNTYTLRYYIEETYNDQHQMLLQLTTDTQNNSPTIRNYISNISSKLSNIKTSIDSMSTDISTIVTRQSSIVTYAGNIYSRLGTTNTTLSDTYTLLYNWQSSWVAYKNQLLDWGTSWNTTFGTISTNIAAINNNVITGFTSLETKLNNINTNLNNIYNVLTSARHVYTNSSGTQIYYWKVLPIDSYSSENMTHFVTTINNGISTTNTRLQTIANSLSSLSIPDYNTVLANVYSSVDGIEGKLDTLNTTLSGISIPDYSTVLGTISTNISSCKSYLQSLEGKVDAIRQLIVSMRHYYTNSSGTEIFYMKVLPIDTNNNETMQHFVNTINNGITTTNTRLQNIGGYIDDVESKMDTFQTTLASLLYETEDINDGIGDVIDAINGLASPTVTLDTTAIQSKLDTIIALLSVPNDTSTIVGDLNSVDFSDDVDGLVDTISELAPFGAVLLMSEEVQILASVAPVQDPSMTIPFEFFGQNVVTIDFNWLEDLRPAINFFLMFLLILSLGQISLKFVQVEAGS